jgi:hypothetical protein
MAKKSESWILPTRRVRGEIIQDYVRARPRPAAPELHLADSAPRHD